MQSTEGRDQVAYDVALLHINYGSAALIHCRDLIALQSRNSMRFDSAIVVWFLHATVSTLPALVVVMQYNTVSELYMLSKVSYTG